MVGLKGPGIGGVLEMGEVSEMGSWGSEGGGVLGMEILKWGGGAWESWGDPKLGGEGPGGGLGWQPWGGGEWGRGL